MGAHALQQLVLEGAAGLAVAQEADVVSRPGVLEGEVADMAKHPAGRLAEAMENAEAAGFAHALDWR